MEDFMWNRLSHIKQNIFLFFNGEISIHTDLSHQWKHYTTVKLSNYSVLGGVVGYKKRPIRNMFTTPADIQHVDNYKWINIFSFVT